MPSPQATASTLDRPNIETAAYREAPGGHVRTLIHAIALMADRRQQRATLRDLALFNPHLLHDIGLTAEQAYAEAARPFWR